MTINAAQFSAQIVIPTLETLSQQAGVPYSDVAYCLVMGTIAQESLLGTWLVQENGPALGIGQIEPASLHRLISSLSAREAAALDSLATPATPEHNVVGNLPYAVAITRLYYWKLSAPLPFDKTISALFAYYKRWYNTPAGSATLSQWTQNWALTGINIPRG
jgi:hypothetical protein